MSLTGFSLLSSVLCEEVRQESSGQAIIIGAMASGPNISDDSETKIKRLALYLEVRMPTDKIDLYVRLIKTGSEEPVLYADVDTSQMYDNMPDPDTLIRNPIAVVVMGREDFGIKGSGDYHLQYATKEGDWKDYRVFYFPSEGTPEESFPVEGMAES